MAPEKKKKKKSPIFRTVTEVVDNIPMPESAKEISLRKKHYPWDTMKIKHSFAVKLEEGDTPEYIVNLVHANLNASRKSKTVDLTKKFFFQYQPKENAVRVWRVK